MGHQMSNRCQVMDSTFLKKCLILEKFPLEAEFWVINWHIWQKYCSQEDKFLAKMMNLFILGLILKVWKDNNGFQSFTLQLMLMLNLLLLVHSTYEIKTQVCFCRSWASVKYLEISGVSPRSLSISVSICKKSFADAHIDLVFPAPMFCFRSIFYVTYHPSGAV